MINLHKYIGNETILCAIIRIMMPAGGNKHKLLTIAIEL